MSLGSGDSHSGVRHNAIELSHEIGPPHRFGYGLDKVWMCATGSIERIIVPMRNST